MVDKGGNGVKASNATAHTDAWTSARLKFAAPLRNERMAANSDHAGYLGLENIESWTGRIIDDEPKSNDTTDEETGLANVFRKGDVLFGKLRPYLAKACRAPRDGVCSTELLVMRPAESLHPSFLVYSLLTPDFVGAVDASTFGAKMPRASWDFIGSLEIRIPPIEDQSIIANYLDRETARIDGLIVEKEHMLALLEEKRVALISRAVTLGLDPNVQLKPSGQEWLGEIPCHWRVLRLKFAISGIDQGSSPQCYSYPAAPSEWGVLKTGCVNGGEFREQENKALPDEAEALTESEIHQGDVLMSRASGSVDLIGSVAHVSRQSAARLLLSDKIYRFQVRRDVLDPRFIVLTMGARYLRHQIKSVISGAEGLANNIAKSDIMELFLVVPPVPEQDQIISYLDRTISRNKVLCDSLRESIALAKERRAALITAAVTGKTSVEELHP